ncbi:MAG TPA: cytochrome b N-terminal domain-containing protein [Dissulfurispiraceae bacterium]|nr:cytochrome b N-terminal domain-containing protein [Dissulfurispiraceae bacterium]
MGRLFDWVDARFHIKRPHKRFLQRRIPDGLNYTYCFGGLAFTYFLLLVFTGLLLSVYYVPSEKEAYRSIVHITEEVFLGWLVRGIHKWSASLLIIMIILHTVRVFAMRAYRPPRELNWMVGACTFLAAMASAFTGYLLPWDQRAYWATEVGTAMIQTIPFIGETLMYAIRGSADVSGATLVRFYSMHILYLPLTMGILLWMHFHMIKRQGIARRL